MSTVYLKCRCGSTDFRGPAHRTDSSIISCARCGAKNTQGNLIAQASDQIVKKATKTLSDGLKKAGFKVR